LRVVCEGVAPRPKILDERVAFDELEVGAVRLHGGIAAAADILSGKARHLQYDGERASRLDKGNGVVDCGLGTGVFEQQRGMHQCNGRNVEALRGEIGAVKFELRQIVITPAHGGEVGGIDVDADDALRCVGSDAFQSIAAGDAEDGNRRGLTKANASANRSESGCSCCTAAEPMWPS